MPSSPAAASATALPAIHPRTVMLRAWKMYREYLDTFPVARRPSFSRETFARCLANAWVCVRRAAREAAEAAIHAAASRAIDALRESFRTPSERAREKALAEAIAWTDYLPAHMSQTRAIADIRARFAARV